MGALSFSRRAVFKNVSKRQNPIFLRISTAKTMNFFEISQNLKNRTCQTHVFFHDFGDFFYKEKIWRKKIFIWRKWPFFLIKIRKERKNPDFHHILDQNPIFWVNTPQKFEKIECLKMAFVCQIEPSNGQIGDF